MTNRRTTARIESYSVGAPYHIIYKNTNPYYPVGPHSHNAVELYLNLSDLPDVLLNDTVTAVPAGTLLIIPPFLVHQLYRVDSVYERYILSINTTMYFPQFLMSGPEPPKRTKHNKSLKGSFDTCLHLCVCVCVCVCESNPISLFSNVTLIIKFRWY